MAGKSKSDLSGLAEQAELINRVFSDADFELIEPDIIQPADIFLEQIGENIRARTYVFSDLEGESLCLRPDLTIPAARFYLDDIASQGDVAKYRYFGPAFRFQFSDKSQHQPREFEQAGIELFGGRDRAGDEAQILTLALQAVEAAGLTNYQVKTGDLDVFSVIIDQLDIPAHWAEQLKSTFWRPEMFKAILDRLSSNKSVDDLPDFADELAEMTPGEAVLRVEEELQSNNLPAHGLRSVSEIAERLREKAIDTKLPPLASEVSELITNYLDIDCTLREAASQIEKIANKAGLDLQASLTVLKNRVATFEEAGIEIDKFRFCAEFGRKLEYYSGFVFQIEVPGVSGLAGQIAGGGRYDSLLSDLGADYNIPAIGCAIHTERLLSAVKGKGDDNV